MIIYLQMIESDEDKSKFEQLYIMYKGLMFHVAMKILKNEFDAEDAVHQAFLSLIENLKKISDVKCPKTRAYIVIITERKAIDIIRSRSKLVDMEFWESTYGIEIPLPGDHGLADAMARLPAAYRDILLLRYYNGYSVREISSMLHIKKDTAQKQLWRAKAALQKHLKGDAQNVKHGMVRTGTGQRGKACSRVHAYFIPVSQ